MSCHIKARCRYAIKKVPMGMAASPARVLLEVSTLSGLYHAHVVRYFQAWREEDHDGAGLASRSSSDFFASRNPYSTLSTSAAQIAIAKNQRSVTSLQNAAHTPMLTLVGTKAGSSEGPRVPYTSRLDTVEETSLDRLGSPPQAPAAMAPAFPSDTLSTSVPQDRLFADAASPDAARVHMGQTAWLSGSSDTAFTKEVPKVNITQHESGMDSEDSSASSSYGSWSTPAEEATDSAFTFDKGSQRQVPDPQPVRNSNQARSPAVCCSWVLLEVSKLLQDLNVPSYLSRCAKLCP